MSEAAANESGSQSSVLSPLRILLLAVLVLGGAALLFDLRSRRAADAAFAKVPKNLNEGPEEVAKLIGREPNETVTKGTRKIYIWRWPGVFKAYTIQAYFGDEDPKRLLQATINEPETPKAE
ncbi:MAG: hypothetical protein U0836_01665 [Pirellulales bacterium]